MNETEKDLQFFVDEETLELIIEAILQKIKDNTTIVSKQTIGDNDALWNNIVSALSGGTVSDSDLNGKAVSMELLAELIVKGNFLSYQLVISSMPIATAVPLPKLNTIYLLKDPSDTEMNVSMWMRLPVDGTEQWVSLGGVKLPEFHFIDTESSDSVNNVVAHVNRAETDFSGSKNAQPEDIITVQALTEILVALGYGRKVVIPYSQSQGKSISETVGKPAVNTFYTYQQSEDENDWAVYTAAPIINGDSTKYVWLKISGAEGSAPVEVDLSNYWSKDELKPITADQVTEIIDRASAAVGI